MMDSITFLINWSIAETYDLNTAAVMGWIFESCQRVVNEAGEKSGRGWVHVSQEALANRLHLSRQTVAKILKRLIDDRLIQAATSYIDESGKQNYREFYPATKGIRGQTSCCKLISKKSLRRFARSKRRLIALASKEPLSKAGRCYTITYDGFIAMGLEPWEWNVRNHDALLSWGANEAVAAKVGVNAAVVFQYLWFWAHNWKFTPKQKDAWRFWKAYTAASISHWVVFMSDDVILDALHRLEDAGLIMKRRDRWVTEWSIADAGYELMGKPVPCESETVAGDALVSQPPLAPVRRVIRVNLVNHRRAHTYPVWQSAGCPDGLHKWCVMKSCGDLMRIEAVHNASAGYTSGSGTFARDTQLRDNIHLCT